MRAPLARGAPRRRSRRTFYSTATSMCPLPQVVCLPTPVQDATFRYGMNSANAPWYSASPTNTERVWRCPVLPLRRSVLARVSDRIHTLRQGPLPLDFSSLGERARAVTLARGNLQWHNRTPNCGSRKTCPAPFNSVGVTKRTITRETGSPEASSGRASGAGESRGMAVEHPLPGLA